MSMAGVGVGVGVRLFAVFFGTLFGTLFCALIETGSAMIRANKNVVTRVE
jgi:hypothetical protein